MASGNGQQVFENLSMLDGRHTPLAGLELFVLFGSTKKYG